MPDNTQPTVAELRHIVEEALVIKTVADRFEELKTKIKSYMLTLKWKDMDIPGKGRVWVTPSEKKEYSPELVEEVLGKRRAKKIIEIKRSVSNETIETLIKTRDITPEEAKKLEDGAKKTPTVSLYIRPLK